MHSVLVWGDLFFRSCDRRVRAQRRIPSVAARTWDWKEDHRKRQKRKGTSHSLYSTARGCCPLCECIADAALLLRIMSSAASMDGTCLDVPVTTAPWCWRRKARYLQCVWHKWGDGHGSGRHGSRGSPADCEDAVKAKSDGAQGVAHPFELLHDFLAKSKASANIAQYDAVRHELQD